MSRLKSKVFTFLLTTLGLLAFKADTVFALRIDLDRPGPNEFVRDLAGMITSADEGEIKRIAKAVLSERATPILIVTISSMDAHGGSDLRIETFARLLFDQWGIGHKTLGKSEWNTGILLLVSEGDRKARIELGAGWGREKDDLCSGIMSDQIIPNFKGGRFSEGIVAGVRSLDAMARGKSLPSPPKPNWFYPVVLAAIGLAIFTAVSLWRNGAGGWAWALWAAVFALIGFILLTMARSGGSSGGSSGFSGGSFGGGFSGGGGATGSW